MILRRTQRRIPTAIQVTTYIQGQRKAQSRLVVWLSYKEGNCCAVESLLPVRHGQRLIWIWRICQHLDEQPLGRHVVLSDFSGSTTSSRGWCLRSGESSSYIVTFSEPVPRLWGVPLPVLRFAHHCESTTRGIVLVSSVAGIENDGRARLTISEAL